jgi:hypothetical protein
MATEATARRKATATGDRDGGGEEDSDGDRRPGT